MRGWKGWFLKKVDLDTCLEAPASLILICQLLTGLLGLPMAGDQWTIAL